MPVRGEFLPFSDHLLYAKHAMAGSPAVPTRAPLWIDRCADAVMIVGFAAVAAGACHRLARLWTFTIDDAFITARYARNLARGFGALYNPGEAPVEGTSNFLYVVLLSLAEISGLIEAVTFAKLIGVLGGLGILVVSYHCARALGADRALALLPATLLLSNSSFLFWTVGGLETNLYAFLLLESFYLLLLADEIRRNWIWGGICAALAVLTRFDGLLIVPALLVGAALLPRRRQAFAIALGVLLVIVTPWLLWKHVYYGTVFPNCGFAKARMYIDPRQPVAALRLLLVGPERFHQQLFLTQNAPLVVLSLVFGAACLVVRDHRARSMAFLVTTAAFLVVTMTGYLNVKVWMPGHRYQIPLLPILAIGATIGVERVLRVAGSARAGPAVVTFVALLALVHRTHQPLGDNLLRYADRYRAWLQRDHRVTGLWLRDHTPADAVIGIYDAGVVPYLSERNTIDLGGLNDSTVATLLRSKQVERAVVYVLERQPSYLILVRQFPVDRGLLASDEFTQRYRLVFVSGPQGMRVDYPLSVYERIAEVRPAPPFS
jgi:arabinofuranosyltransferase